jgi:hypothetical protein
MRAVFPAVVWGCMAKYPKQCPVCGRNQIQPVMRRPLLELEGERKAISGVLSYRCSNGHVFLANQKKQSRNSQERNQPKVLP